MKVTVTGLCEDGKEAGDGGQGACKAEVRASGVGDVRPRAGFGQVSGESGLAPVF